MVESLGPLDIQQLEVVFDQLNDRFSLKRQVAALQIMKILLHYGMKNQMTIFKIEALLNKQVADIKVIIFALLKNSKGKEIPDALSTSLPLQPVLFVQLLTQLLKDKWNSQASADIERETTIFFTSFFVTILSSSFYQEVVMKLNAYPSDVTETCIQMRIKRVSLKEAIE